MIRTWAPRIAVGAITLLILQGWSSNASIQFVKASTGSATFTIGRDSSGTDTLLGPNNTITDTSRVYESSSWDYLTLQWQFYPNVGTDEGKDSAAVKIYIVQSNDNLHWSIQDSAISTDTVSNQKQITIKHFIWTRLYFTKGPKTDSAGAQGEVIGNAYSG